MNSFTTRTLSGIVFLIVLLAGILIHPYAYAFLMICILLLGMNEFYRITALGKSAIRLTLSYATGFILFGSLFLEGMGLVPEGALWLLVLPVSALFIHELYTKSVDPFRAIALSLLGVLYVALPFSLTNAITLDGLGNYDHRLLLTLFLFLWANDVGAYCFGMLFGRHGRHKLFERISPKKSWEGFWGGVVASLCVALLTHHLWTDRYGMALHHWLMLALIVSVVGTYGDLVESLLKRSAGVKDSANMIPGHGGILDRFDGALLSFPCAIAYLQLIKLF